MRRAIWDLSPLILLTLWLFGALPLIYFNRGPFIQNALDGVVDLSADSLVPIEIEPRKTLGLLDPLQILRGEVLAVLAEQINAVPL